MKDDTYNLVMVILALGAAVSPVLLMALLFYLAKFFLPKTEFQMFRELMQQQHLSNTEKIADVQETVKDVQTDVKELLQR